jgi:hypothetical protein
MKNHTLTLLDTKEVIIAKTIIIKNRIFLLNIETIVFKCLNACVNNEIGFGI